MGLRCDVTTRDDGAGFTSFPFNIFDLITEFLTATVQATITTIVAGLGGGFTFVTSELAMVSVEEVVYPYVEEETVVNLGGLFSIQSAFNPVNTKDLKFSVDFTGINKALAVCTDNFFNLLIGTRPVFQVSYETTQMIMGVKEPKATVSLKSILSED